MINLPCATRCLALVAILCVAPSVIGDSDQSGAIVLNVRGDWRVSGQPGSLRSGQIVALGARLTTDRERPENSMTLVLFDGKRLECSCHTPPEACCVNGLEVPIQVQEDPLTRKIFAAVMNVLLEREPETQRYAGTLSRGLTRTLLGEVVAPAGSPVPLAAQLKNLPRGTYELEIDDLARSEPVRQSVLKWDGSPQLPSAGQLGAGLYKILLTNPSDELAADVWVYSCRPNTCADATSSFQDVVKLVDGWGEVPPRPMAHKLLRSYLLALAKKSGLE